MTWSEEHPAAVQRANETINICKRKLDTNIVDSCITACQDSWNILKEITNKKYSEPYLQGKSVQGDSKSVVDTGLDIVSGEDTKINELFDETESPKLPEEQEEWAKSFIGALVLKNGKAKAETPSKAYLEEIANSN